jgi:hypothetical protein
MNSPNHFSLLTWVSRQQQSKWGGEAQHPLAHQLAAQYDIDQQRGTFGHSSGATARAEALAFAAKRD